MTDDDGGAAGAGSDRPVVTFGELDLLAARQRLDEAAARQTTTVGYLSRGHCLIVGPPDAALAAAGRLEERMEDAASERSGATLVHVDPAAPGVAKALTESGTALFTVPALALEGYLGAFTAHAGETDLAVSVRRPDARFDLVLDLSVEPLLDVRLPPFGYVHAPDEIALEAAIEALAGLVGEFDKPRYFAYDASICAHSRSRLAGCSRCIDVCVTGAIAPAGDGVAVDPYLCQGCGSCATLCPSGAMVYAYPKPSDAIARTRAGLAARREATGQAATTLLLHGESLQDAVDAAALPDETLSLAVEEVSAFGIDYWASVLCAGIGRVLLVTDAASDDPNRLAVESQAALLQQLVGDLLGESRGPSSGAENEAADIVRLVAPEALSDFAALPDPSPALAALATSSAPPGAFRTHDDKRVTIRLALDTLTAALPAAAAPPVVPLAEGSPFGRIAVDEAACTLCMACVSTCPAGALLDGQDTPALRLVEASCVQCGLCEQACPEAAITLEPRYLRDSVAARRIETLHEEAPFHCVVCHKPFATRRIVETMLGKLSGHRMFRSEKARRRLKMCEDCRVRDIFDDGGEGIDVHGDGGRTGGGGPAGGGAGHGA